MLIAFPFSLFKAAELTGTIFPRIPAAPGYPRVPLFPLGLSAPGHPGVSDMQLLPGFPGILLEEFTIELYCKETVSRLKNCHSSCHEASSAAFLWLIVHRGLTEVIT